MREVQIIRVSDTEVLIKANTRASNWMEFYDFVWMVRNRLRLHCSALEIGQFIMDKSSNIDFTFRVKNEHGQPY